MRKEITWRQLKGLHQLYEGKTTRVKLMSNIYVKNILHKRRNLLEYKDGSLNVIKKNDGFDAYFEKQLLDQYQYYADFFETVGIEISAKRTYSQDILETLLLIYKNREELRNKLSTSHIFSSNFFEEKDSKFLDDKPQLKKDILTILGVDKFPRESPKDQQYRLVVDCLDPKYILLCENKDFLKDPFEFRKNNIELWYLGGNNTKKLYDIPIDKIRYPIYYVCDWDFHGLDIYTRIKKIIAEKGKNIALVVPENPMLKPSDSGKHPSDWKSAPLSGLDGNSFSEKDRNLIGELMSKDKWIEEQTIEPIPFILNYKTKF
ncbi:toprim domain-containing protein [Croceivirga radicis]|uniref:hypothetical protein n=1 Tax=Croceivirga radicis TaxID=1929488 RepID=UPI0003109CD7|nr:hypothetical protein [Croceivirga radicis]